MDDRLEPEASTSADIYAHLRRNNGGDFDRYDMNGHKHKRHNRSSSDTILSRPTYLRGRSSVNQLESVHQERVEDMGETYRKERSNSFNEEVVSRGPTVSIDIHTYMTYEKLCTRQEELKIAYNEVSKLANIYESMVDSLKETYDKRSKEFQGIEVDVKAVMDEQSRTEKRVQEAEEKSSKLLYDMKGLSDKLKEIEDSVGSFYMKVGNLEQKMDHSQESITIVGNYFNHYWIKMKEWFDWLNVNK
ncbi:hypothetical protein BDB01DRAFT_270348 [Pilobolus umbonatus]|nr:hypothetical protein BDB01DRAFT_270348 [Pilobolus umbonatus]